MPTARSALRLLCACAADAARRPPQSACTWHMPWPAAATRTHTHAARPPMAMALGPPSGHRRYYAGYGTLYSSGFVRWIYSTERAVNLHARRFAHTVCIAETRSEMVFADTPYMANNYVCNALQTANCADSVSTALHHGTNSACNQQANIQERQQQASWRR